MANRTKPRRKVFVSFHEDDIARKEEFVRLMGNRIINQSVDTGDVDDTGLTTERVRQIIRDDYISAASVTVVLIGPCTWQRKHVDWEIRISLRDTDKNSRSGLLGILLPNHPNYRGRKINPYLLPPRLADNRQGNDPYAIVHRWPDPWTSATPGRIGEWINRAFHRKNREPPPDTARKSFGRIWARRPCSQGWTD